MCGISGVTYSGRGDVQGMVDTMQHRGPDGSEVLDFGNVTLGHNLLSIRGNPSRGKQPVIAENSAWSLVFNGEIYNTKKLALDLGVLEDEQRPDTELLYEIICKYGWNFIERVEGMYALAVYNREQDKLCLYRDYSGQKPLYYAIHNGELLFASEIKALMTVGFSNPRVDPDGLNWSVLCGYIPNEHTIIKDVRKVLPGQKIEWNNKNKEIKYSRLTISKIEQQEGLGLRDSIQKSVREHLASSHPVALNLSGGMDSAVLLYEISQCDYPVVAYTSSYEGASGEANEELRLAKKLARRMGVEHREIRLCKRDYWENFYRSHQTIEEPNGNIAIPLYSQVARLQGCEGDGYRVVFTGCGGDELFYGYDYYEQNFRIDQWLRFLPSPVLSLLYRMRHGRNIDFKDPLVRWNFNRGYAHHFLNANPEGILTTKNKLQWAQDYLMANANSQEGAYQGMLMDRCAWLANENFMRMNKLFMNYSVETRSPFAHGPLRAAVDKILCAMSPEAKRKKKILRELYTGLLPDSITKRKRKVGWHAPLKEWYNSNAKDFLMSMFAGRKGNWVNWEKVTAHVNAKNEWPGKIIHLYGSLAAISDLYKLDI